MAITYSISGGADGAKFNINASTGVLTFKAAPDFENPGDANGDNVYEVQVKATDAGGAATTQDIRVTVKDVSENLPPQITSAAAVAVNENQLAVITVVATDPDEGGSTPPPQTGWPGAGNTGVPSGTTLTVVNGNLNSTANNQVIEAKDVKGTISVNHTGVTIQKCKAVAIRLGEGAPAHSFTVQDCTMEASGGNGIWLMNANDGKILRCNMAGYENFIVMSDGDRCLIQDNWLRNPLPGSPSTAHTDGVQFFPGNSDTTIVHNFFDFPVSGVNSCVTTNDVQRIVIDNCKMQCRNYCVYWEGSNTTGCVIKNSMLDRGGATSGGGYVSGTGMHGQTYTNNTKWDGTPLNLP